MPLGIPPGPAWQAGLRVTWIGLWVNLLLAGAKIAVGWMAGSKAVLADGFHSLSDLVSDVLVLVSMRLSAAPSDQEHPYGHGKFENLGALAVAVLLGAAALGILVDSILAIISGTVSMPGAAALAVTTASLGLKELLFRRTLSAARAVGSDALLANAWHHRSDALSSLAVLLGLAGAQLGVPFCDPIAACLVALIVGREAWRIGRRATGKLTDEAAPEETVDKIYRYAAHVEGVEGVHEVRGRWMGSKIQADLHLLVPQEITVSEGHRIGEELRLTLLRALPEVAELIIHVEPEDHGQPFDLGPPRAKIRTQLAPLIEALPQIRDWSLTQVHYSEGTAGVDLCLFLPPSLVLGEAETLSRGLRSKIDALPAIRAGKIRFAVIPSERGSW